MEKCVTGGSAITELTLEQVDGIYPMIDRETKPTSKSFLSYRVACKTAARLYPVHGGGGLLIGALILSNGFETWEACRKGLNIKKISSEHLVPVMEANPDFLPLPAPESESPEPSGENHLSKPSQN